MAGYIKSHSNYRLQSRHQVVDGGVILERDISTVGGVNSFATGQATVYQSGNFVMVINNGGQASRHIRKKSWLSSGDDNDTWTEEILSQHSSDVNGSVEKSIMLKNDFMDLRSFAYYGSLADLIQNTVLNIVSTYPYELYYDNSLDYLEAKEYERGIQVGTSNVAVVNNTRYYYTNVTIQPHKKIILQTENSVILQERHGSWYILPDKYEESGSTQKTVIIGKPARITDRLVYYQIDGYFKKISNPGNIDIHNISSDTNDDNGLGHFYGGGYTNYEIFKTNDDIDSAVSFTWQSNPVSGKICPTRGERFAIITITVSDWDDDNITLYAYWDDNLNIIYLTDYNKSFHIRPKHSGCYYDDFIDNLDLFGKCLMGVYSGVKNTSKFEILRETETGTKRDVEIFTLPTGLGGYNINSDSYAMREYINSLGKIGIRYDEQYTDNLLRMMTHDSLKNLDWTNNFNGNDGDEKDNEYIKTGEKFSSVMRVIGYTFDQEKAYIDSIGNVNTVTYSNRDNLSDYFLTDALEEDGITTNTIYPYELTEFDSEGIEVRPERWNIYNQFGNNFKRKFSENTADIISPYSGFTGAYYTKCVDGEPQTLPVPNYNGEEYYVDDGKSYNVTTDYHSFSEISIPEVNNEFMKRLKINSKNILRKKGTIDGIESILSLFGLRSKRWCGNNDSEYDFSISESTYFAPPIVDDMDVVHRMYKIDWYNSCKTIPYETESYINGIYIPYQGLPIAYREVGDNNNKYRKLYPSFQHNGIYDGDMYYQMNGGWIGYMPYRFDIDDKFLVSNNGDVRVETMRNIMQVKNMSELLEQPIGDLFNDIVYYVNDTSEKFALINGYPYPLKEESLGDEFKYYFEVEVYGGAVSVGGELYEGNISVSDRNGSMSDYDLSLYEDGTVLRIYYTGSRDYAFEIEVDDYYPDSSLIFINGTYNGDEEHMSHYFILKDISFAGLIGDGYWEEIANDSRLYQMIENITDNTIANNPHSGNFSYDNGEEYLNRFRKIFKYASEYRYFNESCFSDVSDAYSEINSYGFDLEHVDDSKVHSFVDRIDTGGTEIPYDIDDFSLITDIPTYSGLTGTEGVDGVTSQIINTKNVDLIFRLHFTTVYSKEAQEEIKYIQCKIMPYVEQIVSSTSIMNVYFVPREVEGARIFDETFDETFN